jgi:hypothetical protein
MLADWHEFYGLIGTAAAALVALLFVAASIGASILTPGGGATRTFLSPVIFHYSSILFISLIALVPTHTPMSLGAGIAVVAVIGFGYSIVVCARLVRMHIVDLADRFTYGAGPLAAYAATFAAAGLLFGEAAAGANVLAAAMLVLLAINIRNAWDLMLALATRATQPAGERTTPPGTTPPSTTPPSA